MSHSVAPANGFYQAMNDESPVLTRTLPGYSLTSPMIDV